MTRPWRTVDTFDTPDGAFALRQRGENEFLITLAGRILMNSAANRSEIALGRAVGAAIGSRRAPRVLIGGLGMGCTLRAALDALPDDARVRVSELQPGIVRWCRGPLAGLTGDSVRDPRVEVRIEDVAQALTEAGGSASHRFDAVLLDLYEGAHAAAHTRGHPHFGDEALIRTHAALTPNGVLSVWTEQPEPAFEGALGRAGFEVRRERPSGGPRRHVVYVARRSGSVATRRGTPRAARRRSRRRDPDPNADTRRTACAPARAFLPQGDGPGGPVQVRNLSNASASGAASSRSNAARHRALVEAGGDP